MANQFDYEDDYEDEADQATLIKDLRRQLRAKSKEADSLAQQLEGFRGAERERTVAEILSAKGVSPKAAKFIPADKQSEDEISAWLDEFGDVFGAPVTKETTSEPQVDQATVRSTQRLQSLSGTTASPAAVVDFTQRIANATSQAEVEEILAEAKKFQL